ncbi:hypothetical protein ACWFNE_07690 [Cellulomonas sp. NPDC055163]
MTTPHTGAQMSKKSRLVAEPVGTPAERAPARRSRAKTLGVVTGVAGAIGAAAVVKRRRSAS